MSVKTDKINPFVAVILSLEFIIIPPVLNPLVYGLKLPEIRRHIVKIICLKPPITRIPVEPIRMSP